MQEGEPRTENPEAWNSKELNDEMARQMQRNKEVKRQETPEMPS